MTRFQITLRRTVAALFVGLCVVVNTGCTSVAEHRVDATTGQVTTVNRHQFFVKSLFGGKGETVATVQPGTMQTSAQPMMAANQPMTQQQFAPRQQQFALRQQQMAPQQYAPQQAAPQYPAAGQANSGMQPAPAWGTR